VLYEAGWSFCSQTSCLALSFRISASFESFEKVHLGWGLLLSLMVIVISLFVLTVSSPSDSIGSAQAKQGLLAQSS
jgi:hypothetical protein